MNQAAKWQLLKQHMIRDSFRKFLTLCVLFLSWIQRDRLCLTLGDAREARWEEGEANRHMVLSLLLFLLFHARYSLAEQLGTVSFLQLWTQRLSGFKWLKVVQVLPLSAIGPYCFLRTELVKRWGKNSLMNLPCHASFCYILDISAVSSPWIIFARSSGCRTQPMDNCTVWVKTLLTKEIKRNWLCGLVPRRFRRMGQAHAKAYLPNAKKEHLRSPTCALAWGELVISKGYPLPLLFFSYHKVSHSFWLQQNPKHPGTFL